MKTTATQLNKRDELGLAGLGSMPAEEVLSWAFERFHPRIALASSFQHCVLIHMALQVRPDVTVFSIDTGRLPEETYECARAVEDRFGIRVRWYFPERDALERLVREKGVFSFRRSPEDRRECCRIRKVEPLTRALQGLDAWITGLRRDQGGHRGNVEKVERDDAHGGVVKINPLADWTWEQVREYERIHDLPYNKLFDRGYTSIGCVCCTRALAPGEHPRAGRWWWEQGVHKECGLHVPNWNI
ncbi:MAG: phosphoadenylyl-sulfate reductase [Kiritimatiellaeota bacterium]|nr:phosphoadenylyl-sulfate reductase [Kiritimatiellota bacterium]